MSSPVNSLLISLYLVLELTVGLSLVWGQTPTRFAIQDVQLTPDSNIPITNVGAGGAGGLGISALACFSVSPSTAVWLFPDGSVVPLGVGNAADNTINSLRQATAITLHRGDGFITPSGQFCCGSPTNENERLCITLGSCPLLVLTNGLVTYNDPIVDNAYNSITATHTCSDGYLLVSESTRICDIAGGIGIWRGTDRTCNPVDCGTPPAIDDGSRTFTTTTFQGTATYTCNIGYIMSGPATVSCLASGNWSTRPTCTARFAIQDVQLTAGSSIPITNVGAGGGGGLGISALACFSVSPSTAVWLFPDGSMVPLGSGNAAPNTIHSVRQVTAITLHRGDGFITPSGLYCCGSLTDVNERLCITLVSCPLLVLTNGIVSYTDPIVDNAYSSITATHTCSDGYLLVSESTRTCDIAGGIGIWRGTDRTCNPMCSDLPSLTNGVISYSPSTIPRLEGATATYSCADGYQLSSDITRTCVDSGTGGTWNGMEPICLAITVVPPGDPPVAGQSYSLICTVTGADSLNPTINYQWFKTTSNRTQVGTNSPTLTFDPLVLSDAGHYTCEVTISSSQLSQVVTIRSNEYEIRFATLNIQLLFNGVPDCGQYTLLDPNLKTHDITSELVQGVESLCWCGFNTTFISSPFLQCFDDSPQHVTYRALLTETNTNTTVQLVSYIKQWTASTQSLVVQSVRLGINTTCPVAIVDFNIPECPDAIYDRSTSPPPTVTDPIAPLPTDPLPGDNGGIIGGMVAGVFVLVIIVAAVIVIVLVGVRHRKTGSKDVQNNTRIVESQVVTVVLSEIDRPSLPDPAHPQPYETVGYTESHEYEDLGKFQEGDNYEQIGHPSGPPKGKYDFTQCPAYATNKVSGQRGAPATQVTQGDDILYEN